MQPWSGGGRQMACKLPYWKGASDVQPRLLEKEKAGLWRADSPGLGSGLWRADKHSWRGRGKPVACRLTWLECEARPMACCLTCRRGEEVIWCAASPG